MGLLFAVGGVFALLVLSELLWRSKLIRGEAARKFVHIAVGTYVAFWPYFLTWRQIELMSFAFLVGIIISRQLSIFHAVHEVARKTQGEIFFPIGIGLSALIMPAPIVFTAAILHLSLADGLAAVVGTKYGMQHRYMVRNNIKTIAGTAMFYLVSTIIIVLAVTMSGQAITMSLVPLVLLLPLAATIVENFAVGGTDNIFVPLLIIAVLQTARIG